MKTQLLIATDERDYAEHLSNALAERYADVIDAFVCSEAGHLREQLASRKFDVALLDGSMAESANLESIRMPLLLWTSNDNPTVELDGIKRIRKYQRISSMISNVLEQYARNMTDERGMYMKKARITAVWSPMGGVGKTTAALAYSAAKASEGKQTLYLDMEPFSSVGAYFAGQGSGISAVFEMLETGEGNISMLARGIRQQDANCGIAYFGGPENFDDMNILSPENAGALIEACSEATDELVIDMSCVCDERARKIFELADRVLFVIDSSRTAQIKYAQFMSQNSVFQRVKDKAALVANKGAAVSESILDTVIHLPFVQSSDAAVVYKTLSRYSFEH